MTRQGTTRLNKRTEDGVLLRGHTQLVVEGVVPDLLHVVPVRHDAVLNGVLTSGGTNNEGLKVKHPSPRCGATSGAYLEGEHTALGLGLVADVGVLLVHAHHDLFNGDGCR